MTFLALLVIGYAAVVGVLYVAQDWLLFPGRGLPSHAIEGPLPAERTELATADGALLRGLVFPAEIPGGDLLIGFGGNAQDAELLAHDLADDFRDLTVAVFHYRGYGPSTGRPSEAALLADALAIHDALVERWRPAHTYAIGISLGSAVAAYLSRERPLAGIVLVTPFDSIEAIAKETYFWVPVGLLLRHRFATVEFMADNPTPVAILAAAEDRVVPPRRTQALITQVPNLVYDETLAGAGHNTLYQLPIYDEVLRTAFATVRTAADDEVPETAEGNIDDQ